MTLRRLALALALAAAAGCGRTESCLGGGADCRVVEPCAALAAPTCEGGSLAVRTVAEGGSGLLGADALGAGGDVVLENDRVVAVIDELGEPHLLAPTGGTLLDLGPRGGFDALNQLSQVAGVLPDDAFHYDSLEIVDERPARVAVIVRGTLDGRRGVKVATRWELRPCEAGVRVRSELYNGTTETQAFFVSDVSYWGGREPLPFAVASGQGFMQPKLSLLDLDASWGRFPFVAATSPAARVAYATVSCDRDTLEGVNDVEVSALGAPPAVVGPGESVVFERFVMAAAGGDVEGAARLAVDARRRLGRAPAPVARAGRVVAEGGGTLLGGAGEARASVVVAELDADGVPRPITQVVPGDDGAFVVEAAADARLRFEVWSFGRLRTSRVVAPGESVGELAVPSAARLHVTVGDGEGGSPEALVSLVPADAGTRDAVVGTQHGRLKACAPWLGPPHGGSPACNQFLAPRPEGVLVPAGHYFVYATMGPFATLARAEVTLAPGEIREVALGLEALSALAPGLLSADFHVHGRASFDSAIPDVDRVRSFAAAGVDVVAATDHDVVVSYEQAVADAGLGGRLAVISGVETTGLIPFLEVPGDPFPRVIGHFNFWPVEWDAAAARGGAPWDELLEPGELIAKMPEGAVAMLNHPWDEPMFGRDLGYLRAIGYDPRVPIPGFDDGTNAGMLARAGNLAFDVVEVLNGRNIAKYQQYRALWWSLLSQARVSAGAANSDSHGMTDAQIGSPRNLVATAVTVAAFDEAAFDADVRAGRMQGTNGPVILATVDGAPFGLTPIAPAAGARLEVEVRAAPWIPVSEVRVIVNGRVVATATDGFAAPADPFGAAGLVRWQGSWALAELLAGTGGGDAWLLVEAGLPLGLTADLDDDGVVDTTDNDGDGDVDLGDVAKDEETGPLADPADPVAWSDDPRFHVCAVAPGTWPLAFTNPWLLDMDGGGWEAPGL